MDFNRMGHIGFMVFGKTVHTLVSYVAISVQVYSFHVTN